MSSNSSEILLRRCQTGSVAAAFEIHERYRIRLLALARQRLMGVLSSKVDAEDISQETFMAFFEKIDRGDVSWDQQGDIWRLLAGIAINKVRSQFEFHSAEKRHFRLESETTSDQTKTNAAAENPQTAAELSDLVEHLLDSEKPMMRTVFTMRLAGYTSAEIAAKIRRTPRTVRRLLDSLRAKIVDDNHFDYRWIQTGSARPPGIPRPETDVFPASLDYREFQLLRMIGQGSFAKVYLARHQASEELFAIKSLQTKWFANLDARRAFFQEAEVLKSVRHPNVVRIHGICRLPNNGCFLVLDLVHGICLTDAIAKISFENVMKWLAEIASALCLIHLSGIAHGDLRTENIMINDQGNVRILDFGLAQHTKPGTSSQLHMADILAIGVIISKLVQHTENTTDANQTIALKKLEELASACRQSEPPRRPIAQTLLETIKHISGSSDS